jgi:hypothetical protein
MMMMIDISHVDISPYHLNLVLLKAYVGLIVTVDVTQMVVMMMMMMMYSLIDLLLNDRVIWKMKSMNIHEIMGMILALLSAYKR